MEDLRKIRTSSSTDNNDGSRQDNQSDQHHVVANSLRERSERQQSLVNRVLYGDALLLVLLLEPFLDIDASLQEFPWAFTYSGCDCSHKWSAYLGEPQRCSLLRGRLSEALGVTEAEVAAGKDKIQNGVWTRT